jgi:predicted DNA-binding transcriptional regulator AlpA
VKLDTRAQAARIGLSHKTLNNWRSLGSGPPFYKLGGRIVYDAAETDAWLAARRRTGTSDRGPPSASSAP